MRKDQRWARRLSTSDRIPIWPDRDVTCHSTFCLQPAWIPTQHVKNTPTPDSPPPLAAYHTYPMDLFLGFGIAHVGFVPVCNELSAFLQPATLVRLWNFFSDTVAASTTLFEPSTYAWTCNPQLGMTSTRLSAPLVSFFFTWSAAVHFCANVWMPACDPAALQAFFVMSYSTHALLVSVQHAWVLLSSLIYRL